MNFLDFLRPGLTSTSGRLSITNFIQEKKKSGIPGPSPCCNFSPNQSIVYSARSWKICPRPKYAWSHFDQTQDMSKMKLDLENYTKFRWFLMKKLENAKCRSIFLSSKSFAWIGNFACMPFSFFGYCISTRVSAFLSCYRTTCVGCPSQWHEWWWRLTLDICMWFIDLVVLFVVVKSQMCRILFTFGSLGWLFEVFCVHMLYAIALCNAQGQKVSFWQEAQNIEKMIFWQSHE